MLCEDTDAARAEVIADRLRAAAAWPFDLGSQQVQVSASVGISTSDSTSRPPLDPAELLRRADVQMYVEKRGSASRTGGHGD